VIVVIVIVIVVIVIVIVVIVFKKKINYIIIKMKIIILVIATDNPEHYVDMQEIWRTYGNSHPNIKTYFVKAEPGLLNDVVIDESRMTIWVKGFENLRPGILQKTVKAIKYIDDNFEYDYIVRTNLSTVYNLNKLYNYIVEYEPQFIAGQLMLKETCESSIKYHFVNGKNYNNVGNFPTTDKMMYYVSGSGFILSKIGCKLILLSDNKMDYKEPDDLAISKLFEKFNINYYGIYIYALKTGNNNNDPNLIEHDKYFQYRCLTPNHVNTVNIMGSLVNYLYKICPIVNMNTPDKLIYKKYLKLAHINSDIFEHLPTLYRYSRECDTILESGVRNCVSSWAFASGLLHSHKEGNKKLLLNDINKSDEAAELVNLVNLLPNLKIEEHWISNLELEIEPTDMVFIDTWHVYGQLKRELAKFRNIAKKYIILHDTTVDGEKGETIRRGWNAEQQSLETGIPVEEILRGLWAAVEEFLKDNDEWELVHRYKNCNGLTILRRVVNESV